MSMINGLYTSKSHLWLSSVQASSVLKRHSEAVLLVITWSCALVKRRICRPTGDGTGLASSASDLDSVLKGKQLLCYKFLSLLLVILCLKTTLISGFLQLGF